MTNETNKLSSNGNGNGNNKNNGKPNTGITGVRGDPIKHEIKLPPRMDKFLFGHSGQVDRYLKARKGLIEWVGTSKEYNNVMFTYLNEKVEPTFPEPTNPCQDATEHKLRYLE